MSTESHQFKIRGMDCAEEVAILKREIGPLVGGEAHLSFDLLKAKMTVLSAPGVNPREVVKAVERTGMGAQVWEDDAERLEPESFWLRRGRTVLTVASGAFALFGFAVHAALAGGISRALGSEGMGIAAGVPLASRVLYSLAILFGVWSVLPKAWNALRRFRPDMNLLMTIAVLGAVAIGEWFEGATVAFLFSLSLALESWSIGRARRAVEALMDLTPQTARIRKPDGHELEIPAEQVEIGALLLVKPGERIPLDGRVVGGASEVNQAPITGESVPVPKEIGAEVFAGTINGDGALEVEATKRAGDSTLAHIIRLVDEAQSRRAPSEQWVEKFARIYTPVVLGLALAVLLLPPLVFGGAWESWIYRALVLLVIACPCALVISTPVSIVAALASAAKNGVLVKGGLFLEIPSRLKAVALDKTGTLTWGRPEVIEIVPLAGHDERELLERVGSLEARSEHPLARAILAFAKHRGVAVRPADDFRILQGKGAAGSFGGKEYWLGSHRYLEERGQETPEIHQRLEEMSQAGQTAVVVGTADHVCGLIAVADEVRPESRSSVQALRDAGIQAVVMLTGDNRGTAEAIGRKTGIDDVRPEMLPAEKVAAIDQLIARYGSVAMIGDGVNDAPAMARATMSVAMGAAGSDAAIEVADVALMSDDLAKLPWLIRHSRRTLGVIRQNIVFSLAIKAVFVLLTLAGHASLWAAIAADMGASLLVIGNGLRLLGRRGG
ncbi:MAG TPA: heavy metal translocating P-type ATPase [Thermoanaerobaculia bacterium]|nr:heavy metal translocating P-type ATPase [Thermoanaerobaculia bacterium]